MAEVMRDPFVVEFDDAGHLIQRGRDGRREPICPMCTEPIRWGAAEMMSFLHQEDGSFVACHARCVWIREAFKVEGKRAPKSHEDWVL